MKEQDLIDLGFERVDVTKEESGCERDYHFYTYDFTEQLALMSNDSEEAESKGWFVEFFDVDGIRFTNIRELAKLMILIENAKI